ncbi:hypothetical protein [Candidimonas nitroreducens]|uniref:Uncharacterized protein n=1 Tax=Candidimonas nitroreducens TaxID=683354 RepID=A0A225MZ34_9BURK|nr:hypothetical protein [Candidimonas nitroreducens]OWT66332.1 hypothetical protein CEY11_00920 [Candidimonas nitroreducens]
MEDGPTDIETRQKRSGSRAASSSPGSGCEVCRQMREAHDKYLARLRRDGRVRRGLTRALVSSMGFCPGHEQLLRSDPELCDWVGLRIDEARKEFALLLNRARLQDEVLQEIVFGARRHCPACLYCRRFAGQCISRKLRDIQSGRARVSTLLSGQLCFEHARQLVQRCDNGDLKKRLLRALRRKGKAIVERMRAAEVSGADAGGGLDGSTVALVEYALDTLRAVPGATQEPSAAMASSQSEALGEGGAPAPGGVPMWKPPCPICCVLWHARASWLDAVSSTIHLEQPAWLALPTCAEHLEICLPRETSAGQLMLVRVYMDAAFAAWRKPKTVSAPVKKRPRSSLRWFDPPARPGAETSASTSVAQNAPRPTDEREEPFSDMSLRCPACRIMDIAVRGAVASWLSTFASASSAGQSDLTRQLCFKHLAEVLIYAPQQSLQTRILSYL